MSVDWSLSGAVVLTGLVLVFVILLVLIMLVEFTSKMVNSGANGKASAVKMAPATAPIKAQNAVVPTAPAVQAGIEEETVAAIMAAVSCMTEPASGAGYAVRSINRAKSERPVWGFAGMQQNTRPF